MTVVLAEVAGLELAKPSSSETVMETIEAVQDFDPTSASKGG
jgi:hypothetical protein